MEKTFDVKFTNITKLSLRLSFPSYVSSADGKSLQHLCFLSGIFSNDVKAFRLYLFP